MIVLCAVCFQGLDVVMRDSLNLGILVLLGVTAVVLGAFASFFVRLARRARAAGAPDARTQASVDPAPGSGWPTAGTLAK